MPSRRLPRDLDAGELIAALRKLGYAVLRQTGSHVRLRTERCGEHHITVPAHKPIKLGTLAAVMGEVAHHHKLERDVLLDILDI